MADKTGDTRKPQAPPESLMIPDAVDILKSPFELSPHGNYNNTEPTNNGDGSSSRGGGGGGTPSLPTSTHPSPELSITSSFKLPRSVSRADSRLAAPLELALNGLERPDGAREARILLPGVDLRQQLGFDGEERYNEQGKDFIFVYIHYKTLLSGQI
jgi:hypothetical protein